MYHCFSQLSVTITNPVLSNCSLLWKMPALMNSGRGAVHLWLRIWEVLVHSHNRWKCVVKPCHSLQRRDLSRKKEETRVLLSHLGVPVDSQRMEGQGPAIPSRCTYRFPEDGRPPGRFCLKGSTNIWWMNSGSQAVWTAWTFGEDSHLHYKDHIPMTWNLKKSSFSK